MPDSGSGIAISADGTEIAYERRGPFSASAGLAALFVGGGLDDGAENAPLAEALAQQMTTVNYSRRGRGRSGDTPPYSMQREIEDLRALLEFFGGSAALFGASSGGALALEAAAAELPVTAVAVYEVPYFVDAAATQNWRRYVDDLRGLVDDDRRDAALELFMRTAGSTDDDVAAARAHPVWDGLRGLAPTLVYDAECIGWSGTPPVDRLARIRQPTLAITGAGQDAAMAGLPADFFSAAADAIVRAVPRGRRLVVETASHVADPAVLAPVLADFFAGA
jgi:hypothetical protein